MKVLIDTNILISAILSPMELIPIPSQTDNDELHIRDITDRPLLRAAKRANVDVILTGDKDFSEAKLLYPAVFSPNEFLNL